MDCSLPASSCLEIFRHEYWNGLLFPTLEDLPDVGMEFMSSTLAGRSFTTKPPAAAAAAAAVAAAKSLQSFPTLCDPIDSSPPGSPIPGILQARILEWIAISFSNA